MSLNNIYIKFLSYRLTSNRYEPTIDDFRRKNLKVKKETIKVEIFDTPGSEEYSEVRSLSIRNSDGFILVYSLDDVTTFEAVKVMREQILLKKSTWVSL